MIADLGVCPLAPVYYRRLSHSGPCDTILSLQSSWQARARQHELTRSVPFRSPCLLPLVDMANHISDPAAVSVRSLPGGVTA